MTGLGWCWEIPVNLRNQQTTLNTLKFLSCYVSRYIEHEYGRMAPLEVVLAQTDSTLAAEWIQKSNFDSNTQPLHLDLAWTVTTPLAMDRNFVLYSQWFPGNENGTTAHPFAHLLTSNPGAIGLQHLSTPACLVLTNQDLAVQVA
jgi:hypothetical protein